eukprot:2929217-Rhodomonas_salina.1
MAVAIWSAADLDGYMEDREPALRDRLRVALHTRVHSSVPACVQDLVPACAPCSTIACTTQNQRVCKH